MNFSLLIDEVLPRVAIRQWVLSLPFAVRYLLATRPEMLTQVLGIVYRAISGYLIRKAGPHGYGRHLRRGPHSEVR